MCFPIKTRFVLSAYLYIFGDFIIADALYNNQLLCQNVTDFTALPISSNAGTGGARGATGSPQYLADQLTLFRPGRQIIPTYYYWHPQYFSPFGITGQIKYLNLIYAGINITLTTESHSTNTVMKCRVYHEKSKILW